MTKDSFNVFLSDGQNAAKSGKLRHGSLFSGIGGFDLAAEWMGWENVFHCEWNEFGKRILNYYWPKAISYDDITKTDFTIHRGSIDILTGGFPCQPYSQAGKRLGKDDDRHLWPEMLRAIREIQPRYIVGENVRGLINWNGGMVFHEVQADLENEGYQVLPLLLPACAVNAPHRRDRVWFIAYSGSDGHQLRRFGIDRSTQSQSQSIKTKRQRLRGNCGRIGQQGATSNACIKRLQGNEQYRQNELKNREWRAGLSGSISEFYSRSNFEQFPTQSPVCNGNDGFSAQLDGITFPKWRNESIKGGGNAIVPQVAFQIFKALMLTESKAKEKNNKTDLKDKTTGVAQSQHL